jgi:hypothetical protein
VFEMEFVQFGVFKMGFSRSGVQVGFFKLGGSGLLGVQVGVLRISWFPFLDGVSLPSRL